jgi:hypothetical protein
MKQIRSRRHDLTPRRLTIAVSLERRMAMKKVWMVLAAGAFCLAARGDDVKKELERYTGEWQAVSVVRDGKILWVQSRKVQPQKPFTASLDSHGCPKT